MGAIGHPIICNNLLLDNFPEIKYFLTKGPIAKVPIGPLPQAGEG